MIAFIRRSSVAAARVVRANAARLPAPLKVNFALTYWCQYRCKTCNIWQRHPADELTAAELRAFIARARGVAWLDLTGGEIFLRPDIAEVLAAFAGDMPDLALLHFPTNGFQTDRIVGTVSSIARGAVPRIVITVSVDGDEALNDAVRGIRGGYRHQIETINALRAIDGVRTVVGMTLSSHNAGQFERTFEACQRDCPGLGITDFHVNLAQASAHYYGNAGAIAAPDERMRGDLERYRALRAAAPRRLSNALADWVEEQYLDRLQEYLDTHRTPMRCHSLRSSCFIDPWGTVYPCITYSRPIGSLRENGMDLGAIWHAASTRAVQQEIWAGQCPQCWTACEAYQSILGNLVRPSHRRNDGKRETTTSETWRHEAI